MYICTIKLGALLIHLEPQCYISGLSQTTLTTYLPLLTVAQSICTLISNLSGRPDIFQGLQLYKYMIQNMGAKKGWKKQGLDFFLLFQKRRGSLTSTLQQKNVQARCFAPCFFHTIFWTLFSKQKQWVQIDWASVYLIKVDIFGLPIPNSSCKRKL